MEFNVAQLLKQHVGATREYDLDAEFESDESVGLVNVGRIVGHVQFLRTDRGILVRGTLHSSAEGTCSRCLAPCRCPVEFRLEEEYFPTVDVFTGLPVPAPEDETALTIDNNHVLDLREAIRQYMIVALPMQFVCRTDCRGLCPQCGQNLNETTCNCQAPSIDPRLAVLGKLLLKEEESPEKKGVG